MNSTSSIITIGREYGSGGRQIGQEVAKYFGIKCYDKELLEHAANDSGIYEGAGFSGMCEAGCVMQCT